MKDYYCERMKSKCLLYKQLVKKAKGKKEDKINYFLQQML